MSNANVFCSRKGGATINGKFHNLPTTTEFIATQLKRAADKAAAKRKAKHLSKQ